MFLIYSTIIMSIIVTVFLVKLLIDLSNLARSSQNFVAVCKHELEPTIKELKRALNNFSFVSSNTDKQVDSINQTINKGLGAVLAGSSGMFGRCRVVSTSLVKGILTGIKVFTSR